MSHAKFKVSDELSEKALEAIEAARNGGKLRIGTNEATKSIERGEAKLVVIAEDVTPPEVVMHLSPLCEEKHIPYCYTKSKDQLGKACGIDVPSAAIAIAKEGDSKTLIENIKSQVNSLKGK